MGLYDRDYERNYDTGSGWRDSYSGGGGPSGFGGPNRGFADWSANAKLLAVLAAVFAAQMVFGRWFTGALALPANWFAEPWRIYSFVSYALLHDTNNIFHLLFNGLALFFFGRTIQSRLGGREYVAFFFAAAAFAGLAWSLTELAADPVATTTAGDVEGQRRPPILLGASGGIAAVIVLFALWYPHVQVYLMGVLPVPAWLMAILFLGSDVNGALSRSGNVAYTAHLGGALFGYLYFRYQLRISSYLPGWLGGGSSLAGGLSALFKPKPRLRVHRVADDEPTEADPVEDRVDEILRKIQANGQDSLTREEQRILERASRQYQQKRR